jgi:hypothetical protein
MVAPCSYSLCRVKALGLEPYGIMGPQGTSRGVPNFYKSPQVQGFYMERSAMNKEKTSLGEGMEKGGDEKQ